MAQKVPVTIVTGFLGAGKTTLLNHILKTQHGMKFAIIENEFGEVGVDDGVLKTDSKERIIEVMNGCICCTVRADLAVVLKTTSAPLQGRAAETSESVGWQNFGNMFLVFGCIGSDFCKKICVLQRFSKSTRFSR